MREKPELQLVEFQKWMQHQLLDPYGQVLDDSGESISSTIAGIEELVCDSKRLSAQDHLAIYQRSYIARLRDCMRKVFPALEYLLGEELFQAFADQYLGEFPSTSYNLVNLGQNLAAYLSATRLDKDEDIKEDWPDFMIELAQFEYATNILFDKEDRSDNKLAVTDSPDEALELISVIELFEFQFPIRSYYSSFVNGDMPSLPVPRQSYCVILRQKDTFRIALFDLHVEQYQFLIRLNSGMNVSEALESLVQDIGADKDKLIEVWSKWKQTWIMAGFFEERTPRIE